MLGGGMEAEAAELQGMEGCRLPPSGSVGCGGGGVGVLRVVSNRGGVCVQTRGRVGSLQFFQAMNQRLKEAASKGDINSLYSIIQEDAYILDRIDQVPFAETPLHISASAGHIPFSLEIVRLKPSFGKKLNPEGYSPMHLALQNNQTETVFRLVDTDRGLVSVQGREGLTPLHLAASGGRADVLAKFLAYCPKSIKELTIRKESALHIAVKNGDIECLKIFLEWIQRTCTTKLLNWTDDEGNNIMHLAALGNKIEMVKLLIKKVDVKSKNLEGMTALDIMKDRGFLEDKELRKMLCRACILKEPRFVFSTALTGLAAFLWMILLFLKRLAITDHREILFMSKEDRNAILVVSVLIATATYQAVLTPPDKAQEHSLDFLGFELGYFLITFREFNTLAFVASMIEICLHLPSGIGYALHLVLPLVICYALLMLFWWSYFTSVITVVVIFLLLLSKFPVVKQKINGDLKPKKLMKLRALLKRNHSLERELTEVSVHL